MDRELWLSILHIDNYHMLILHYARLQNYAIVQRFFTSYVQKQILVKRDSMNADSLWGCPKTKHERKRLKISHRFPTPR